MSRTFVPGFAAALVCALLLSSCASATPDEDPGIGEATEAAPSAQPSEAPEAPVATVQEETCDWDTARLPTGTADTIPQSAGTDLPSALIGAWQHTHFDTGAGFEALGETKDIRYVFPSTERLLYCQDVEGATHQAENAAAIELDGMNIVLPGSAPGFTVTAWGNDTMVWINNLDGSLYLLKRR